jgi:hypothetical protein
VRTPGVHRQWSRHWPTSPAGSGLRRHEQATDRRSISDSSERRHNNVTKGRVRNGAERIESEQN